MSELGRTFVITESKLFIFHMTKSYLQKWFLQIFTVYIGRDRVRTGHELWKMREGEGAKMGSWETMEKDQWVWKKTTKCTNLHLKHPLTNCTHRPNLAYCLFFYSPRVKKGFSIFKVVSKKKKRICDRDHTWHTNPKIFATWPLTENICQCQIKTLHRHHTCSVWCIVQLSKPKMTFRKLPQWLDSLGTVCFIRFPFHSAISNALTTETKRRDSFSKTTRILFSGKEYNVLNRSKGQKRNYGLFVLLPSCSFQFQILKTYQVSLCLFSFSRLWRNCYYVEPYETVNIQPVLTYKMTVSHGST